MCGVAPSTASQAPPPPAAEEKNAPEAAFPALTDFRNSCGGDHEFAAIPWPCASLETAAMIRK
jgi:hypothetical protein